MARWSSDVDANNRRSRYSQAFYEASNCTSKQQFMALSDVLSGEGVEPIDGRGNTILHVVAMHGNVHAFRKLDQSLLTSEWLMTKNHEGETVMHEAARSGHNNVVKFLATKESALLSECNNLGESPLYVAAACGKEEVFNTLAQYNRDDNAITRNDGCTVLHAAVNGEYYSLAGRIVESFNDIVGKYDMENGMTPLGLLATKPASFRSGSPYTSRIRLGWFPLRMFGMLFYWLIPSTVVEWNHSGHDEENQHEKNGISTSPLLKKLISGYRRCIRCCIRRCIRVVPRLEKIDDARQKHALALKLATTLVNKEEDWTHYSSHKKLRVTDSKTIRNPLVQALDNGIVEIVQEILGKFPDAAYSFDEDGKNILHVAVEHKDWIVYEGVKKIIKNDHMDKMLADIVDNKGNNILHLAAKSENPRFILGPVNHMTWDIYWFKHVRFDCPPHFEHLENSDRKTPMQIFEENHSDLRKKAEKAMTEMNNSLMLVTTLICTMNYAALFTLPGDYNDRGAPRLLDDEHTRDDMMTFFWCTTVALFSSLFALVTMLSIQLCSFCTNDFYRGLPFKFLSAMFALYISTGCTIEACWHACRLDRIPSADQFFSIPAAAVMVIYFLDAMSFTYVYMLFVVVHLLRHRGQSLRRKGPSE